MILELRPPGFLRETTVVQELEKLPPASELQHETHAAEMLLDIWCKSSSLTLEIAKKIIKFDQLSLWTRQTVLAKLRELVVDEKVATGLLYNKAFAQSSENFVETILDMVPGIFDINKVAEHIVQHGHWILERVQTVWKSLLHTGAKSRKQTDSREKLLPIAVIYKQTNQIRQSVSRRETHVSLQSFPSPRALHVAAWRKRSWSLSSWHNNCVLWTGEDRWQPRTDREERVKIRNALVGACIRATENMQELCRIFEYSHGECLFIWDATLAFRC